MQERTQIGSIKSIEPLLIDNMISFLRINFCDDVRHIQFFPNIGEVSFVSG